MNKRSKLIRVIVFIVLLGLCMISGVKRYLVDYDPAFSYEVQTQKVQETEDYIVYGDTGSTNGFIFYPDAKVEEIAYAPILDELAEAGICCVLVKMPYHLAVLNADAAEQIIEDFPEIGHWYVGGHSFGGTIAARFAAKHEGKLSGLILLAAYPTGMLTELPVLSIYGSRDTVLNHKKYQNAISDMKNLTEYVIEGGNHAGFGNYEEQKSDKNAEISREEQWQETVDYILNYIEMCSKDVK